MIYQVKYSLLKQKLYVYSSEELDLNKNAIAEIDGEKHFVTLLKELSNNAISGTELGSNYIIRQANDVDRVHYNMQINRCLQFVKEVNEISRKLKGNCKIISCEPTFDVRRIVFYFKVLGRILRLRDIIKQTCNLVKTQVDFRQVEGREIAKLVSTLGVCGLETCCSRFFSNIPIIVRKQTDSEWCNKKPNLGVCGCIKCCSIFEQGGCEQCERKL